MVSSRSTNTVVKEELFNPVFCKKGSAMERIVDWLINYWWRVPVFLVLQMFVILIVVYQFPGGWIELATLILWIVSVIVELLLIVLLLFHKQWMRFFFSVGALLGIVAVLPFFSLFAINAPDGFAKHHPIPEGMKLNIPLGYEEAEVDSNKVDSYLQIWDVNQGGIYEYDFYYPRLTAGEIFLRCFEAGKNEPLSAESVADRTTVRQAAVAEFSKVAERKEFTIYEGDWDEYYAVRVEVWHRDSITHKEIKLMEKLYRMEGWMR